MAVIVGANAGITAGAIPHENSWDVWMNKNLRLVDALLQGLVLDKDLTAPPGSPAMGDLYLVAASPTGAWSGQAGKLAVWTVGSDITSAWVFITPKKGWTVYVSDENLRYLYDGSAWAPERVNQLSSDAANANTVSTVLGSNSIVLRTNSIDRVTFDSSGLILVGTTVSRNIAGANRVIQVESSNGQASMSVTRNSPNATGPVFVFGKTRGSVPADVTACVSGDNAGGFQWGVADGTDVASNAASFQVFVDGSVSTGVVPGRVVISTSNASGVISEAVRWDSAQDQLCSGNIVANVVGKGLKIKEGSNAKMGQVTLSSGTFTVPTTAVTANSRIQLTRAALGGNAGCIAVGTVTAGTSFVINSITPGSNTVLTSDTSIINWVILDPA